MKASTNSSDPPWQEQALKELLALLTRFDAASWNFHVLDRQIRDYHPHLAGISDALIEALEDASAELDAIYALALERGAIEGRDARSSAEVSEIVDRLRSQVDAEASRLGRRVASDSSPS